MKKNLCVSLLGFFPMVLFLSILVFAGESDNYYQKKETIESLLGTGTSGATEFVTKTGQTTSYAVGDDGALQKGLEWPSLRFMENGDGTVTDNLTGLIWLKNANYFKGTKTWDDAIAVCNSLADDEQSITDGSRPGDWRLPNVRELQSLIDFGRSGPALPADHPFTNVEPFYYWSSTTVNGFTGSAWFVGMNYGTLYSGSKFNDYYVWPVRGCY
jgi:hypothetical protein